MQNIKFKFFIFLGLILAGFSKQISCNQVVGSPALMNSKGDIGLSLSTNFIFWNVGQAGMDLAAKAVYENAQVDFTSSSNSILFQRNNYLPGFKVGVEAWIPKNWHAFFEYTYLHGSIKTTSSVANANNVWISRSWFAQTGGSGQAISGHELHSEWSLDLDWLDGSLFHEIYNSNDYSFSFFAGLRSSWIAQNLDISLLKIVNAGSYKTSELSLNHSHSWAIGPRAGLTNSWIIGKGFFLEGNMGGSLLFMHAKSFHKEPPLYLTNSEVFYGFENFKMLAPMAEMNLGFGWCKYFQNEKYFLNINTTYDFNYLFSQNIMRYLNDLAIVGSGESLGALSLYGLNFCLRFGF